ncbi:tetratricopeptide repeat protein [Leisingera aquaemixtae]|uniref:adenylate/guanylate cyclase domain-containing protein n=1 Tax=Leisingera aquaemixtae TaxID=1396826 RepID=UPI0021A7B8FA|nr:tetratricopeptide repeat protein [Leisingera aquaemixtae]UWQ38617.1 tetratricopeptide repeat protein [Leisingera aquaemixtae]
MADQGDGQKQAAILIADVAGYSALAEAREAETIAAVRDLGSRIIAPAAREHEGRVVKTVGDGFLLEFPSAVPAVKAAMAISSKAAAFRNGPRGLSLRLRMGIHAGLVFPAGEDLLGNCVNIAARLQSLAAPGEICISGTVHEQVRGRVGAAFDDLGLQQVRNIAEPVRIYRITGNSLPALEPEGPSPEASVAVLPFSSASPASEHTEAMAQTLTEDITIGLSRFRALRVVSRNAAQRFAASGAGAPVVAAELGVRYLAEGSVRQLPGRLRITVTLSDGTSGLSLWSGRYDRDLSNDFAQQDVLAAQITQTLATQLQSISRQKSAAQAAKRGTLTARELVMQAKSVILDSRGRLKKCRALYQQACDADFGNATAYSGLALTYLVEWMSGWAMSAELTLDKAFPLLRHAARIDPLDSVAQRRLAVMHLCKGNFALAEDHFQRALMLNPNDTDAMAFRGLSLIYQGRPEKALAELDQATAQNPFHPTYFHWFRGLALYMCRAYDPAVSEVSKAIELFPGFPAPHRHLAACYAQLGNRPAAARECGRILDLEPKFSVARISKTLPFARAQDLEHYCDGLRQAGLPE